MRVRDSACLTLLLIATVLLLPLLIPAAVVVSIVNDRRVRNAAKAFACSNCGNALGTMAVKLADEAWTERMRTFWHNHPGVRYRTVRDLHAICPTCGTRYKFIESERTFMQLTAD